MQGQGVSILTPPEGGVQRQYNLIHGSDAQVSILTPPEGGVQPSAYARYAEGQGVSILTPPEGGVQRDYSLSSLALSQVFQSSPRPKAGCN